MRTSRPSPITLLFVGQYIVFADPTTNSLMTSNSIRTVSEVLLENIFEYEKTSELSCSIKLAFGKWRMLWAKQDNLAKLIDINYFMQGFLPIQYNNINEDFLKDKTTAFSKHHFKSSCFYVIVPVFDEETLQSNFTKLIKSVQDTFIFVSTSESFVGQILRNNFVTHSIARKFGVVGCFGECPPTEIKFISDPAVYGESPTFRPKLTVPRRINNIKERTLTVTYVQVPPTIINLPNGTFAGSHYHLLTDIANRNNVTLIFSSKMRKHGFGSLLPNGSWTGMIGELVSGRADISPTLGATLQRFPYISSTTVAFMSSLNLCLKSPGPTRRLDALVAPFTPTVWMLTGLAYAVITAYFGFRSLLQTNVCEYWGWSKILILFYSYLLGKADTVPNYIESRVLLLTWIWVAYVINTAYVSNLVGFLTFLETPWVPNTFKALHEQKSFSIMLHSLGGLDLEQIRTSPNPIMQGISKRMSITKNALKCLQHASHSKQVCIIWQAKAAAAIANNSIAHPRLNSLVIPSDPGSMLISSLAFRKDSIFVETFSRYVGLAVNGNLIELWRRQFPQMLKAEAVRRQKERLGDSYKPKHHSKQDSATPLDMSSLLIVYIISGVGHFVSLGILVSEILIRQYLNSADV